MKGSPSINGGLPLLCAEADKVICCFAASASRGAEVGLEAGGEKWPFSAGTIAVIPPCTPHGKRSESGFADPLYFSRVFKQIEGVSPQRYVAGLTTGMTEEEERLILMDTPEELL